MTRKLFACLGVFLLSSALFASGNADVNAVVDPSLFQAMEFRSVGPYRGGRATAVAGVPSQRDTFYMAPAIFVSGL